MHVLRYRPENEGNNQVQRKILKDMGRIGKERGETGRNGKRGGDGKNGKKKEEMERNK